MKKDGTFALAFIIVQTSDIGFQIPYNFPHQPGCA